MPQSLLYKGVYKGQYGRWQASIRHLGKKTHLGQFDEEADAARAYDEKAREFGIEEAFLNFPVGLPPREGPPPDRRGSQAVGVSNLKGVSLLKGGRFQATFCLIGQQLSTTHATAETAARWYDAMAREAGRPEAYLNYPRNGQADAEATGGQLAAAAGADERIDPAAAAAAAAPAPKRRRVEPEAAAAEPPEAGEEASEKALVEVVTASLPRLRALLQAAEQRAAARDALRAALYPSRKQEDALTRLRELLLVAERVGGERVESRHPRRRRTSPAAAREARPSAAALQGLAAELAALDGEGISAED